MHVVRRMLTGALVTAVVFGALSVRMPGQATAATLVIHGDPGIEVTVDGRLMGLTPLPDALDIGSGRHVVTGLKSGAMPYRREIEAVSAHDIIHLRLELIAYKRSDAVAYSLLLAGTGQRYLGREKLGWVLTGAEVGGLLTALLSEMKMQNSRDDYLIAKADYDLALDVNEITRLRALTESKYQEMSDAESLRNASMYIAAAAVTLGVLDAFFRFPELEAGPGGTSLGMKGSNDMQSCHLSMNFRF